MITAGHLASGPATAMRSLSSALGNRHDQEGAASRRPVGGGRRDGHDRGHPGRRWRGHADGDQASACSSDPARLAVIAAGIAFGLGGPGGVRHRSDRGEAAKALAAEGQDGSPARSRPARTRRPPVGMAGHRGDHSGHGKDGLGSGTPAGGGHTARDGAARSARSPLLNPTYVDPPGGLIDVPRDGHGSGTPGGEDIPEILRTAGPGPARAGPGSAELKLAGGTRTGRPPAGPDLSHARRLPAGYEPGRSRAGAVRPGRPAGASDAAA